MADFNEEVGEYFRKLRVKERLTQEELATKNDLKSVTYSQYERGLNSMPLPIAKRLCKFYGIEFIQFIMEMDKFI